MIRLTKRMKLRCQEGFTLVEVLIALAILSVIGVSAMSAINVSNRTILTSREQTIAESLTRSTIEYIKTSSYDSSTEPGHPSYDVEEQLDLDAEPYYGEYSVEVQAVNVEHKPGVQIITVKIYLHDRLVSTTDAYKVNR